MTPFSISEPFQLFHEANGQPLDNGFIYIGVAQPPQEPTP